MVVKSIFRWKKKIEAQNREIFAYNQIVRQK